MSVLAQPILARFQQVVSNHYLHIRFQQVYYMCLLKKKKQKTKFIACVILSYTYFLQVTGLLPLPQVTPLYICVPSAAVRSNPTLTLRPDKGVGHQTPDPM